MRTRVIAISREFGSGGRTIGRKVAEKLGIPCYDSELIARVAEENLVHSTKSYLGNSGNGKLCDRGTVRRLYLA